jgi:hypothetical protein
MTPGLGKEIEMSEVAIIRIVSGVIAMTILAVLILRRRMAN